MIEGIELIRLLRKTLIKNLTMRCDSDGSLGSNDVDHMTLAFPFQVIVLNASAARCRGLNLLSQCAMSRSRPR